MEITPEMRRIAAALTGRAPNDDATTRLIKNAAFACDGNTDLALVGAVHAKQAELDTLRVAVALSPLLAKAAEPAPVPATKLVRVELEARTRKWYGAHVRVPADATAAQLDALVARLYARVHADDYQDDDDYWEKGECSLVEAADDATADPVADFTARFDDDGDDDDGFVVVLAKVGVGDRIRCRLALLAAANAQVPVAAPTWIKLYSKGGVGRWLVGGNAFDSMFSDKAFTFVDRAQAERVIAEFPTFFTDGSYELVAATARKG